MAIDPNFKWALDNCSSYSGNYTEAITYLDKALAIDPKFEDALYNKALAQRLLEHTEVVTNHSPTIKAPTQQTLPNDNHAYIIKAMTFLAGIITHKLYHI